MSLIILQKNGIPNIRKSAYHGEITGLNYQPISSIRSLWGHWYIRPIPLRILIVSSEKSQKARLYFRMTTALWKCCIWQQWISRKNGQDAERTWERYAHSWIFTSQNACPNSENSVSVKGEMNGNAPLTSPYIFIIIKLRCVSIAAHTPHQQFYILYLSFVFTQGLKKNRVSQKK